MQTLIELIRGIRNVRSEYEVDPGRRLQALAHAGAQRQLLTDHAGLFDRLARVETITFLDRSQPAPDKAASIVVGDATVYLPLAGMIDLDAERQRLTKELENITAQLQRSMQLLQNPDFLGKANPGVVERERAKVADLETRQRAVQERLEAFS